MRWEQQIAIDRHGVGTYLASAPVDAPQQLKHLARIAEPAEIAAITTGDGYVFWAAGYLKDGLFRARPDGSSRRRLAKTGGRAFGIVLSGRYLYWIERNAIGRIDEAGARLRRRFIVLPKRSAGNLTGLTTDGRYLYFGDCGSDSIGRVGLNGRGFNAQLISSGPLSCPLDIAYTNGFLYWTAAGGFIGRATVSGSSVQHWLKVDHYGPVGLAADAQDVFWGWGRGGGAPPYVGRATAVGRILTFRFLRAAPPLAIATSETG